MSWISANVIYDSSQSSIFAMHQQIWKLTSRNNKMKIVPLLILIRGPLWSQWWNGNCMIQPKTGDSTKYVSGLMKISTLNIYLTIDFNHESISPTNWAVTCQGAIKSLIKYSKSVQKKGRKLKRIFSSAIFSLIDTVLRGEWGRVGSGR